VILYKCFGHRCQSGAAGACSALSHCPTAGFKCRESAGTARATLCRAAGSAGRERRRGDEKRLDTLRANMTRDEHVPPHPVGQDTVPPARGRESPERVGYRGQHQRPTGLRRHEFRRCRPRDADTHRRTVAVPGVRTGRPARLAPGRRPHRRHSLRPPRAARNLFTHATNRRSWGRATPVPAGRPCGTNRTWRKSPAGCIRPGSAGSAGRRCQARSRSRSAINTRHDPGSTHRGPSHRSRGHPERWSSRWSFTVATSSRWTQWEA